VSRKRKRRTRIEPLRPSDARSRPKLATRRARAGAWLIDNFLVTASLWTLLLLLGLYELPQAAAGWSFIGLAVMGVVVAHHVVGVGLWGATIGMWCSGVRVVDSVSIQAIGIRRALLRTVAFMPSRFVPYGGELASAADTASIALRGDRRSLRDLIVGTTVVSVRAPREEPERARRVIDDERRLGRAVAASQAPRARWAWPRRFARWLRQ
jgi:uncharacterized RDD family membrane protein YckC